MILTTIATLQPFYTIFRENLKIIPESNLERETIFMWIKLCIWYPFWLLLRATQYIFTISYIIQKKPNISYFSLPREIKNIMRYYFPNRTEATQEIFEFQFYFFQILTHTKPGVKRLTLGRRIYTRINISLLVFHICHLQRYKLCSIPKLPYYGYYLYIVQ